MNKYQKSLNYIVDKYIDIHYDNKVINEDTKHALCLQELVNVDKNELIKDILGNCEVIK